MAALDIVSALEAHASGGAARLAPLFACVDQPSDFAFADWVMLYSLTLQFRPQLIVQAGRGWGNSTCVLAEAALQLGSRLVSYDPAGNGWRVTAPKLVSLKGDEWVSRITIVDQDFAQVPPDVAGPTLFFWDPYGSEVAHSVIRAFFPRLGAQPNLVIVHDITDLRGGILGANPKYFTRGPFNSPGRVLLDLDKLWNDMSIVVKSPALDLTTAMREHPGRVERLTARLPESCWSLLGQSGHWVYFQLPGPSERSEGPRLRPATWRTLADSVLRRFFGGGTGRAEAVTTSQGSPAPQETCAPMLHESLMPEAAQEMPPPRVSSVQTAGVAPVAVESYSGQGAPAPVPIRKAVVCRVVPPDDDLRVFDAEKAMTINGARLAHLAALGLPLAGKRVLDVGSGPGYLAQFFVRQGCDVLCVDGREENVAALRRKFPGLAAVVADVERHPLVEHGTFDIVFCYGLLDHLENPIAALRNMELVCRSLLLLETIVTDHELPLLQFDEESASPNQALRGLACRPTLSFLTLVLSAIGFTHLYTPATPPAHEDFQFDRRNDLAWIRDGHPFRSVLVASKGQRDTPNLVSLE